MPSSPCPTVSRLSPIERPVGVFAPTGGGVFGGEKIRLRPGLRLGELRSAPPGSEPDGDRALRHRPRGVEPARSRSGSRGALYHKQSRENTAEHATMLHLPALLFPLLAALLDRPREIVHALVERGGQLLAPAQDRPGRLLLHEAQNLVHALFVAGNRGGPAMAMHDRLVALPD